MLPGLPPPKWILRGGQCLQVMEWLPRGIWWGARAESWGVRCQAEKRGGGAWPLGCNKLLPNTPPKLVGERVWAGESHGFHLLSWKGLAGECPLPAPDETLADHCGQTQCSPGLSGSPCGCPSAFPRA